MDTGLVPQMRDAFALIERDLGQCVGLLAGLAVRHKDTVMTGRTHPQHTVPVTFGYKAAVWLAGLLDARDQLADMKRRILVAQYGGAAGTLSAIADRGLEVAEASAAELDLAAPDIAWHVRRGGIAEAGSVLSSLCGTLAKIAADVILLSQTEVGEVAEPPAAGRGGGGTMPQKRNPVLSEYVLASTRNVHALLPVLMNGMIQDHERPTDSWQAEWVALPQMFVMTAGAIDKARSVLDGLVVDPARIRTNLDLTDGLIMAEAVQTALRGKLGHEQAHHVVEAACRPAMADGLSLRTALGETFEIGGVVGEDELDRIFDPAHYTGRSAEMIDRVVSRARP